MPDRYLDVCLDFDTLELGRHRDPTRTVYEASHKAATEKAENAGGVLRYTDPRETDIATAVDPLTGRDVLLVSTRWVVDGARVDA